ncbi:sulfite exporter TauE/SafE family protein [Pseudaestuariivita atlantica]|uniref:Probable membrane transporter protein n=1 Tax=Pseudaestuariivita atlantica TaxID=1317121 RepID=A0A0L1JQ14_9RHOB|nr:sulfite exporter TauE/SafE family protein [Pseudaestuariivita atlantica]KNG93860.1 hypothetical protein ATO11_11910 [Pseudaestuariivita atlantica]
MAELWPLIALSPADFAALVAIVLAAGIVRGFTGFALSAFALAIGVLILPPVQLIPVLWWLEIAASILMLRGGLREADNRVALILVAGSFLGMIVGLGLTTTLDPNLSRQVALVILIALAALQLGRVRMAFLGTTTGTVATGLIAGLVTGLAGVGGMVVALYVLARQADPRQMRATLVVFLFLGSSASLLVHLWYGTMNAQSTLRGLALVLPCMAGVLIGQALFTPRLQPYYRPVCLWLLIGLGALALARSLA